MTGDITLATWNVEWAVPRARSAIHERLQAWQPDILVVTEGDHGVPPDGGFAVDGGTDWGYDNTKPEWRKVILWSRWPIGQATTDVPDGVRSGRLIDARVDTPWGPVRVLAVCIPWRDAHVRTGRGVRRRPWDEHLAYVAHLASLVRTAGDEPLIVMGDFNQRLPRTRQPRAVCDALLSALEPMTVVTHAEEPLSGLSRREVDHIAVSAHFAPQAAWGVDRHEGGRRLSDHDAVLARVAI